MFGRFFGFAALTLIAGPAMADGMNGASASVMWGTGSDAAFPGAQSATMHVQNGISAGQVNAALDGLLYGDTLVSMTAVGAQTVINTEIIGDDNTVDVDAEQSANNSGDQGIEGVIVLRQVGASADEKPSP